MNVLVRIRYSQALRFVPSWNWWKAANALTKVSWTRSSASAGLRVIRSAAAYSWSRNGSASRSKRAPRCLRGLLDGTHLQTCRRRSHAMKLLVTLVTRSRPYCAGDNEVVAGTASGGGAAAGRAAGPGATGGGGTHGSRSGLRADPGPRTMASRVLVSRRSYNTPQASRFPAPALAPRGRARAGGCGYPAPAVRGP